MDPHNVASASDTMPPDLLKPRTISWNLCLRERKPLLIFLLLCCLLPSAGIAQQKQAAFPPVTSYSLDKQKVSLPSELEGQTNLLLISFKPEHQQDINSWLPTAQALQHTNFQFRYYQLPVAERENFIFRWWETSSMRSDQTDPSTWHWTIPLWVDRRKFLEDLTIPNEKQVVALLVDRQGRILWRASGPMTADSRASLMTTAGAH
jgi:hypothetical protein